MNNKGKAVVRIILLFPIFLWFVFSCKPSGTNGYNSEDIAPVEENIGLSTEMFSIEGDMQPFNSEIRIDTIDENKYVINLNLYTDFPSLLPRFQFSIKYPRKLVHGLWSSRTWSNQSFITIPNYARLQSEYNIVSAIAKNSQNRISLASFDDFYGQYTQIDIKEVGDSIEFSFNFFNDILPDAELLDYTSKIFVDFSSDNYSNTIRSAAQWRLDFDNKKAISKVDMSLKPVYSVWYPMDRNIPLENITHYFDSISSMGFNSVLFDDGWQNVVRFEVDTTGMWDPSDIDVIKDFIAKTQETNMKIALWYSQPFVGAHNYVFKHFENKYLQYRTSSQPILDIRYPEVRDYLTEMYAKIVSEWEVDGIWFDFLNGYYPNENIIITEDYGRDFVSVRKALDSLKTQMQYAMLYERPDISINQSYKSVGPLHTSNTKTINGFLGTTVLTDVREKLVNNRLLYGEYSPFMEVIGIHPKDPAVDVAKKFQSVLFGTPYVSYFSYTLPEEVQQTLRFWITYWKSNAHYLTESEFKAYNPVQRYTVLIGGNTMKQILVFYNRVAPYDFGYFNFEMADVINSSNYPFVSVKGKPTGKIDFITYDHKGVYVDRGTLKFKNDVALIEIPIGGYSRLIVK
ncbi:MAG: alpha-galactosidase [Prolixibacteraceae bacterium]|nr:alpha-galactosidase [Prolixibacteraceae bacterium]MBN2649008.1 alpha-galactosidase [Prolixibacteraceae bacterium]